jgi:hypothetical protein
MERWELLGLLLTSGSSVFGLIYATPSLATLTITVRAPATFSLSPEASLGLAGLALSALGSLAAIIMNQLKPPGGQVGASLIIWANFVVLLLGDVLFYAGYLEGTTLLIGLVSAALTVVGLLIITGRPRAGASPS